MHPVIRVPHHRIFSQSSSLCIPLLPPPLIWPPAPLELALAAELEISLIRGTPGVGWGVSVAVDGATDVSLVDPMTEGSSKARSSGSLSSLSN